MAAGVTIESLTAEMDKALQFPGVSNAWTMPIKARIDMLATGIRTPVGIKVLGKDLTELDQVAKQIETVVRNVPGTTSAYAERVIGGYYLDIVPDRDALARYGLIIGNLQDTIAMALGGEAVTTTVEGRERYTVNVRYPRDFRDNPEAIAREVLVPLPPAAARCRSARWPRCNRPAGRTPSAPRTASLQSTSMSTCRGRDLGGYVSDAQKAVVDNVKFPPGLMCNGAASSNTWSAPSRS